MTSPEQLQPLVRDVRQRLQVLPLNIAVVGDMILDNAIEGVPGGVHPETKVQILRDATSQESIGGAANIALALARLGAQVSLFGIVGSDLPGRQLENMLDRQAFATHLITERGWPTPRKDYIYRRAEGRLESVTRIDYDRPLPGRAREELVGEFRVRCPPDVQVVILADHGLGSIGPESLALIGIAMEREAKIVAIPRSTVLRGQFLNAIVINATEMRRLANAGDTADPRQLAARYALDFGVHVFLTLMEDGLMVYPMGKDSTGTKIDAPGVEVPDWMGVRDITTAIVGVGMGYGMDPVDIGRFSSIFRTIVAAQRGNGRVLWRDVYRFVGIEKEFVE
jgi:D-beta-D-heptose 7-phosphate kinase/D-beta-D-heptose 1-phosphate adenosyltransferase